MKRYQGGTMVPPGLYWSPGHWAIKVVSGRRGMLEGEEGANYLRVPGFLLPFVALLGAVAGGLYIVFLPIVGFALLVGLSALQAWRGIRRGIYWLMALLSHHWVPGESHFTGKGRRRRKGGP